MKLLGTLRSRFGDFWWHALLLFCAMRLGDVVNAFIALWLVPRYVPQKELGAVLPLGQFVATLALPLSVFGMAFMKYVGTLAVAGERGQVKSLMRGVFLAMAVVALLGLVVSRVAMGPVLERLRVEKGMLGGRPRVRHDWWSKSGGVTEFLVNCLPCDAQGTFKRTDAATW